MSGNSKDVFARLDREAERHVEELKDYLRIPSISTDPAYRAEVERAADWLIARMQEAGLATEKIATAGHPLVYAEWTGAGPGAPTVLFYGHYDVQPPDPLEEWRTPAVRADDREGRCSSRAAPPTTRGSRYAHVKGVEAHPRGARASCRSTSSSSSRARRRSGGEAHRGLRARGPARAARLRLRGRLRHRRCSRPASRRSPTACAGSPTSRSASRGRTATCTPASSAAA